MQSACTVLNRHLSPVGSTIFSTLSHSLTAPFSWGKNVTEPKTCVLTFTLTFAETVLIVRRIQRHIIKVNISSCEMPAILAGFQSTLNILDILKKNTHISYFMKILQVAAEFFHAGRHDEDRIAFRNTSNKPTIVRSAHTVYFCVL